tara:strand:+ start:179071 stop:179778 length:708 start_codon:yes stop_codon:yes gene_type:complete
LQSGNFCQFIGFGDNSYNFKKTNNHIMKAHTRETQATMTPQKALQFLKEGNLRFQNNLKANRNLLEQVNDTSEGQFPFATILSCIDSRVSAELVFDQGLGDIFSVRIAGNFVNEDILGSMEFASKLAGTKLIVVLGHTSCGAVKGACDDAKMGNLTGMLAKIKPAVESVSEPKDEGQRNSKNLDFVDAVAEKNVTLTIDNIRNMSPILKEMEDNNEIDIVGAMYDINTGAVSFFE